MDQGMKENHTATLHPCHGWGPQVQHGHLMLNKSASLTAIFAYLLKTHTHTQLISVVHQ